MILWQNTRAPLGRMGSENWWDLVFFHFGKVLGLCSSCDAVTTGRDVTCCNSQCLVFPLCRKGSCTQTAKCKGLSRETILWQWSLLKLEFRDVLQAQISEQDPSPCSNYSPAHHPLWHNSIAPKDTVPKFSHWPAWTQLFWGSQKFRDRKEINFENNFSYHILVMVSSLLFMWISTWSFRSVLLCFISIQQADLFMG